MNLTDGEPIDEAAHITSATNARSTTALFFPIRSSRPGRGRSDRTLDA
jgi:hypothetical protein